MGIHILLYQFTGIVELRHVVDNAHHSQFVAVGFFAYMDDGLHPQIVSISVLDPVLCFK